MDIIRNSPVKLTALAFLLSMFLIPFAFADEMTQSLMLIRPIQQIWKKATTNSICYLASPLIKVFPQVRD